MCSETSTGANSLSTILGFRNARQTAGGLNRRQPSVIVRAMKTLEAARAAQDFTRFLREVHLRQESFKIVKGGVALAYLLPSSEGACDSYGFADDLASTPIKFEDRRSLSTAIRKGRKALKPLKNPWG